MSDFQSYFSGPTAGSPYLHEVGDTVQFMTREAPFQILHRRHGNFGAVYITRKIDSGWISSFKTPRADKPYDRETFAAFAREASIWLELPRHTLLAAAYKVVYWGGRPYVNTEYFAPVCARGASLADLLASVPGSGISRDAILAISEQLLQAMLLLEAQPKQVTHGDIKPANIMMRAAKDLMTGTIAPVDLAIALGDFGLARAAGRASGALLVDVRYAPPEAVPGWPAPRVHGSSLVSEVPLVMFDLYAMGCTLYEMIFGEPFQHQVDGRVHSRWPITKDDVVQVWSEARPDLPISLLRWLSLVIHPSPAERWRSVDECWVGWRDALADGGGYVEEITVPLGSGDNTLYPDVEESSLFKHLLGAGKTDDISRQICLGLSKASSFINAGAYPEGLAILNDILVEVPNFASAIRLQGHAAILGGQSKRAIALYLSAIGAYDVDLANADIGGYVSACGSLAQLLVFETGDASAALHFAMQAIRRAPNDSRTLYALGLALLKARQYDTAKEVLIRGTQIDCNNRRVAVALAALHEVSPGSFDPADSPPGLTSEEQREFERLVTLLHG